jgi:hypothetical protein
MQKANNGHDIPRLIKKPQEIKYICGKQENNRIYDNIILAKIAI